MYQPKGFPFPDDLGLTAVIGSAILWVIQEYELEVVGWEKNFVMACANDCQSAGTLEEFNLRRKAYAKAIRKWKAGRYLKHFNPVFNKKEGSEFHSFQGFHKGKIYLDSELNGVKTPGEAYDALQCIMPSVEFILNQLKPLRKAA
jgi:hypothetical protein